MNKNFIILLCTILSLGLLSTLSIAEDTTTYQSISPYSIGGPSNQNLAAGQEMKITGEVDAISELKITSIDGASGFSIDIGKLTQTNLELGNTVTNKVFQVELSNNNPKGFTVEFKSEKTCQLVRLKNGTTDYATVTDDAWKRGNQVSYKVSIEADFDQTATPATYYGVYAQTIDSHAPNTATYPVALASFHNHHDNSGALYNNFTKDADTVDNTLTLKFLHLQDNLYVKHATYGMKLNYHINVEDAEYNALFRGNFQDHITATITDA